MDFSSFGVRQEEICSLSCADMLNMINGQPFSSEKVQRQSGIFRRLFRLMKFVLPPLK
jgi:hypothetical protein